MNGDQGGFNHLWDSLMAPVRELQDQVTNINRLASRAEVAGAVEVVGALPAAGEKGRLLFLSTDNMMYFDNGTTWIPMGGATIAARMEGTDGATITTGTLTIVNFQTVSFDPFSTLTTGAGSKFTAPLSGYYQVNARIEYDTDSGWADLEACFIRTVINANGYSYLGFKDNLPANARAVVWGSDIVPLSAGDDLQIDTRQNSGGNAFLTTTGSLNFMSVAKVG